MTRKQFLQASLALTGAIAGSARFAGANPEPMSPRLGITMASYGHRWRNRKEPATQVPEWQDALDVLDHCANLGAGCLQIGVNKWTTDFAGKVRSRREALGIELEGQIRLPWKAGDLERFESDLLAAKEAGASVVRAVCLGGRRYESFETRAEWDQFVENSYKALERAEPVLARCQMRLGVENHKDWRADEHLALLRHLDSEYVGITFDFGNNLALLEDPVSQAEKLAPFIVSTHTKDMALAEFEEGFLLSEVPLGTGRLDLVKLMKICQEANPQVWFNLEMITRDPLKVPVLTQPYWETFDSIPARDLADRIALAKQGSAKALPQIEGLSLSETIRLEETHVRESFANSARMPVAN